MTGEPFPLTPVRFEPRGEFPDHGDEPPQPRLTGEEAKARALQRLADWRATHG